MQKYDMILSLTSWKGRIYDPSFLVVLLSMLKQNTTAKYKVVLVLSEDEFPKKEEELPQKLVELDKVCDYFEILWTKENTRAYKKYFPTRRKYPEENIVPLDDDSPLHSNFVEVFKLTLEKFPDRMIIGTNRFNGNKSPTIVHVRFGCACFRPNSLYPNLDEFFGRNYFHEHDDEFFVLLSVLNGTKSVLLNAWELIDIDKYQQNAKLTRVTHMDYRNLGALWDRCFREHPELAEIYNRNKNISNA